MNKTFTKAIHHLSQPLSLLAILLLFLNDHVLRVLWPSWITGKLGDFAWLFFAPFALAAVLALLIPASVQNHEKLVGLLAFGIVGTAFFLGNSFAATHAFILAVVDGLLPFPVQIIRDPADLVALCSLIPAWMLWQNVSSPLMVHKARGAVVLTIAACLTIANAPPPDYGIQCLHIDGNRIIATSSYYGFTSDDGGSTWQLGDEKRSYYDCPDASGAEDGVIADPDDASKLFRMNRKKMFEYSQDHGQTWQEVPKLKMASQAEGAYIESNSMISAYYAPGPFFAIRDPQTRNLILSMGLEGVVVITPDNEWKAVPVGQYGLEKFTFAMSLFLLNGEILLALELGLLIFYTLRVMKIRKLLGALFIGLLWLGWAFITIMLMPALNNGYGLSLQYMGLAAIGIMILFGTGESIVRLRNQYPTGMLSSLAKVSVAGAVVFLAPYFLWAANIIPEYTISMVTGLVLCSVAVFIGYRKLPDYPLKEQVVGPEAAEDIEDTNED